MAGGAACAAVFLTYSWDGFVARQFERFAEAAAGCDVFITVDETNGPVGPIPFGNVIRFTAASLVASGLPDRTERGPLLWWNPDYVPYHVRALHPGYDTYAFVEYDVVISGPIAPIAAAAQADGIDLVCLPIQDFWFWARFHHQTYRPAELRSALICFTLLSGRAVDHLRARRVEMAAPGATRYWPSAEAFIPTEAARAGLHTESVARFGDISRFNWQPAYLESDVAAAGVQTRFHHPVLDERRYAASTLRSARSVAQMLYPRSALRRRLRRIPHAVYRPMMARALLALARQEARQRFDFLRLWLQS